jgi:hypothetical protein
MKDHPADHPLPNPVVGKTDKVYRNVGVTLPRDGNSRPALLAGFVWGIVGSRSRPASKL